jgi:hypothetical protein
VNATATLELPASSSSSVSEGGVAATRAPGVTVLNVSDGTADLFVRGGTYNFVTS